MIAPMPAAPQELPPSVPVPPPAEQETVMLPEAPVQAVASQIGDVAADTVRLIELQAQLFGTECRQTVQVIVRPLILFGVALLLAVATLTGLLLAAASALHEVFALSDSVALLAASIGAMILTAVLTGVGWSLLQTQQISFIKSKSELLRTIAFLAKQLNPQAR
jgi:hypothetical protein